MKMIPMLICGGLCAAAFFATVASGQTTDERKKLIQDHDSTPASQEALDRRERSNAVLQKAGVHVAPKLPVIADSKTAKARTKEEIAQRAMALCIVSVKATGGDQDLIDSLVKKYGAEKFFSPEEAAFIKKKDPTKDEKVAFSWRFEDYWVLLWTLGYVDKLDFPKNRCDEKKAVAFLRDRSAEDFIKDAKLRDIGEILDEADLIYRCHWATDEARANEDEAPGGLNSDVVMEWHYALNWLIGYMGQEWDKISTDT